ncbi:PAS domain-containing hybrid sensor histidine kinase/response regulator [Vibrio pectenicida]|uniref:histidine kinase n=1 Tax=Vibrio pectenicida TaxID=62763 RepID=A0A427U2R2_9VIBR|nr:PAS domain-containing hybrid sensor histidine kinase/response regulator [Vibrio pectenicida]RSD30984.1 sensor histidine kinase [Vibrio pectenicida]
MQGWQVITVSLMYLGLLFIIAWYGDRKSNWLSGWRPIIYSLSITVYCTSWIFYGTVGQASVNPWSFIPLYLGPILVFTLLWRVLARLLITAKRENITSIADFIAARYGKSQKLAIVVTLIAVIGILPYIALQFRAITMGLELISPQLSKAIENQGVDISWFVVAALAVFTILFGTRYIDNTEHHRGLMKAIAFESVIKLVAFLTVGCFIVFISLERSDIQLLSIAEKTYHSPNFATFLIHTLLTMLAILCLPRQFHSMVVENERAKDLKTVRWVFPIYLLLMAVFVLPIAWVGQGVISGISPDTYMISLPMALGAEHIALIAFLGGTSAACGMVIVSMIALAIMMSNDLVIPLMLRWTKLAQRRHHHFSKLLLMIRRVLIVVLFLGAWGFYHVLGNTHSLSTIGFLSFAAVAQFAPAILGGMYWRKGNRKGVYAGLGFGFVVWLITLLSQTPAMLADEASREFVTWLVTPPGLFIAFNIESADWGMLISLLLNASCYVLVSLVTRTSLSERLQSGVFIGSPTVESDNISLYQSKVTIGELEMLAARFVGSQRVRTAFDQFFEQHNQHATPSNQAPAGLIRHTERVLAGVFGTSSAKLVLSSALQGRNMQLEEVATIVDEASELYDFSRGLLQGAIEHIGQGIAVVDKQQRLVAWNQRYLELFTFPQGFIQVGRPIADVISHNAEQGLCGPGDPVEHVRRRLYHLNQGTKHTSSRVRPDGRVIEVQGNPMPGGGFVMSFSDITAFRDAEKALQQANESLEERVHQRTRELEQLNKCLVTATQRSELESKSKSRFLAAVSHDLMQPLNAARLFASSLSETAQEAEAQRLSRHIETALEAAEDLIGDLLDISRLESGKLDVNVYSFAVNDVLSNLNVEFSALAKQQGISFEMVPSKLVVLSDPKLLRRVVQNFLTNAFRYNPKGKVVLGVRLAGSKARIEVWDNGVGIALDKQQEIFEEFNQGSQVRSEQGLGLGLAISKGIAHVLGHDISMRSWPEQGSVFSITLSRGQQVFNQQPDSQSQLESSLYDINVLCVDNEPDILIGMENLLQRWGCNVRTASDLFSGLKCLDQDWKPDVIMSDYRLDNGRTGLEVLQQCRLRLGNQFEGIIISADRTNDMMDGLCSNGFHFIPKPVKPLKLRTLLNRISTKETMTS